MAGSRMALTIRHCPRRSYLYLHMISLITPHPRGALKTTRCIVVLRRIGSVLTRATSRRSVFTRHCGRRDLSPAWRFWETSMKRHIRSILLCIFFAALIAIPVVLKQASEQQTSIGAATPHETVLEH